MYLISVVVHLELLSTVCLPSVIIKDMPFTNDVFDIKLHRLGKKAISQKFRNSTISTFRRPILLYLQPLLPNPFLYFVRLKRVPLCTKHHSVLPRYGLAACLLFTRSFVSSISSSISLLCKCRKPIPTLTTSILFSRSTYAFLPFISSLEESILIVFSECFSFIK
ncbi:hypothetical protein CDAR_291951 [Caerostris darwini]|uniref:Uncharacterized protein n=1 Tax=Caerostris darwini TaxID=1538125 RepID=A0AAV4PB37_9ARAC|nr:hypothetical protein CDAR_291951 [Caerostris darwini]